MISKVEPARPEARARTMMIRAAADLLQRHGYHGTGVADILTQAQAPRGSLYHHFPGGKRQIVLEALDYSAKRFARDIEGVASKSVTLAAYLEGLTELSKRDLIATGYASGCPMAAVALDVPVDETQILERCSEGFDLWSKAVATGLVVHGFEQERALTLGRSFVRLMLGATMVGRATRQTTAIDDAAAQFVTLTTR